jgi:hypothetical protein
MFRHGSVIVHEFSCRPETTAITQRSGALGPPIDFQSEI